MSTLKVAFWNVENLYEPGTHANRGPQSDAELSAKLDALAETIDSFFGGRGPDILALAEVHNDRILDQLRTRLVDSYRSVWEPALMAGQSGLGALARTTVVSGLTIQDAQRPSRMARPRSVVLFCSLKASPEPFLLVVNHWKSQMPAQRGAVFTSPRDRQESARWLGDYLSQCHRNTCALVLGDFNCEPVDAPFNEIHLRSTRFFSTALRSPDRPACLYNASWRFLTEPTLWDAHAGPGPAPPEPRPKTTHVDGNLVWDQLMVSGRALKNGPIRLLERTVDYHRDARTSRHNKLGILKPVRWAYQDAARNSGTSDHYPLVAEFEIL